MHWKRLIILALPAFIVTGLDRWTKIWAIEKLAGTMPKSYWNDFFRLQYAHNEGAFLSLGSQLPEQIRYWVLAIIPVIVLLYILYHVLSAPNMGNWIQIAFGLILGGGGSNIFDRITQGYVVDFLNMGLGNVRTGIFNVADMAIMAGLFLLLPSAFKSDKQKKQETPEEAQDQPQEAEPQD